MIGPPGAGKTMLASRLRGLLPPPSEEEALEMATIASVAGTVHEPWRSFVRPFRAPHHSASEVAILGGGDPIRPGEVTLAHGGVLFLDELPEFRRNVIEALRPTMQSGRAVIARARQRIDMPARPLVVAAMNPCPCGYEGDKKRICRCTHERTQRYRARISGPILDRFDIHVQLPPVPVSTLERGAHGESSRAIRERVSEARAFAHARASEAGSSAGEQGKTRALASYLDDGARRLLLRSIERLGLSIRAYGKVLEVSRTIADLAGSDAVSVAHVAEAIQYRLLDRDADARAHERAGPTAAEL